MSCKPAFVYLVRQPIRTATATGEMSDAQSLSAVTWPLWNTFKGEQEFVLMRATKYRLLQRLATRNWTVKCISEFAAPGQTFCPLLYFKEGTHAIAMFTFD